MLLKRLALGLSLAAALGATGCGSGEPAAAPEAQREPQRPRDIVLIVIDTLRASSVGAYAGQDRGTPVLDRLAREGVVFERASSASSYTRESVLSLFTGRLPSSVGRTGWNAAPAGDTVTLPFWMRRSGRRTVLASASVMLEMPGFLRGFDEKQFVGGSQSVSRQSRRLSDVALAHAARDPERPLFLYVHYLDPHAPYDPPVPPERPPGFRPIALYDAVRGHIGRLRESGFGPGEARFEDLRARYAAELRDVDAAVGHLLEGLAKQGRLERALVVVTSDHGEEFLEHGYVEHAWTLYEESLHVPLVFHAPGMLPPARVRERVSAGLDVLPSILTLAGLEPPPADGQGLFRWDGGAWQPDVSPHPIHSELGIQSRLLLRSVVRGSEKAIVARRWLEPEERARAVRENRIGPLPAGALPLDPWGAVVHEECFDLAADPGEQAPLAGPRCPAGLRDLIEARHPATSRAPEPVPEGSLSDEERRRLEALGYL